MITCAIVGATGLVGSTFLKVLEEKNLNIDEYYLFASKNSKGKKIHFMDKDYVVEELTPAVPIQGFTYALFSAGSDISKEYAKEFVKYGTIVIDNSSAFRMDKDVPLVVPEINFDSIKDKKLISNPNCSTIQAMLPLAVLEKNYGIKRIVYSTYQAVSGAGKKGIDDLMHTSYGFKEEKFPHKIYGNCIPHIDNFLENGYTKEEMKMYNETRKLMHSDIEVSATCIRVPSLRAHSEAIWAETERPISVEEAREAFSAAEGVILEDNPAEKKYPMPLFLSGKDPVYVGRIRKDLANPNGITFWCVGDQIKKGAALNAVQIAEYLIKEGDIRK